jgi:cytochrome P450
MKIKRLYEQRGWPPAPTLAGRDEPEHRQMRALFDHAFRPSRIKAMDPFIEELADRLVDDFIDDGRCDWVRQFAVPLPLIVIGKQMGAPEDDIWRIKAWTDAWVQRLGMMQTEEQAIWSTEMEIEAQHTARRHLAQRPGEHGDPRMGASAERQRTARRDDG